MSVLADEKGMIEFIQGKRKHITENMAKILLPIFQLSKELSQGGILRYLSSLNSDASRLTNRHLELQLNLQLSCPFLNRLKIGYISEINQI